MTFTMKSGTSESSTHGGTNHWLSGTSGDWSFQTSTDHGSTVSHRRWGLSLSADAQGLPPIPRMRGIDSDGWPIEQRKPAGQVEFDPIPSARAMLAKMEAALAAGQAYRFGDRRQGYGSYASGEQLAKLIWSVKETLPA